MPFGMVGYITVILLVLAAVFLAATKATGKIISIVVSVGIVLFIMSVLKSNGII